MFVNKRLKICREKRKLSIEDTMVAFSGVGLRVSGNTIRNWEQGQSDPSASQLEKISKAFGRPITYFFN